MRETPPQGTLTPDDFRRIREVFESAVERSAKDRRAFVEQACGGNTMLVAEVNRMLDADAREDRLLNRDDGARPTACPSCHAALNADDRFCRQCGTPAHGSGSDEGRFRAGALFANRFRIVTRLGRGGMGDVYRADDLEVEVLDGPPEGGPHDVRRACAHAIAIGGTTRAADLASERVPRL